MCPQVTQRNFMCPQVTQMEYMCPQVTFSVIFLHSPAEPYPEIHWHCHVKSAISIPDVEPPACLVDEVFIPVLKVCSYRLRGWWGCRLPCEPSRRGSGCVPNGTPYIGHNVWPKPYGPCLISPGLGNPVKAVASESLSLWGEFRWGGFKRKKGPLRQNLCTVCSLCHTGLAGNVTSSWTESGQTRLWRLFSLSFS
jgi:hypothetical protein